MLIILAFINYWVFSSFICSDFVLILHLHKGSSISIHFILFDIQNIHIGTTVHISQFLCTTYKAIYEVEVKQLCTKLSLKWIRSQNIDINIALIEGFHYWSIQAGAELGQAQLKLGLGFTSTKDSK